MPTLKTLCIFVEIRELEEIHTNILFDAKTLNINFQKAEDFLSFYYLFLGCFSLLPFRSLYVGVDIRLFKDIIINSIRSVVGGGRGEIRNL